MPRRTVIWMVLCLAAVNGGGCGFFGPRVKPGVKLAGDLVGRYTLFHLRRHVRLLALFMDRPAEPAALDPRTWSPQPARAGRRLLVEETVRRVLAARPGADLQPVFRRLEPAGPRSVRPVELGRFSTPIMDRQAPRIFNLVRGAKAVDGWTILPGRTFSLNALVDTEEMRRVYRPAPVIGDDGEIHLEPGGGLCQLATTLYNAVLAAGFPVLEVHRHSQPVSYAPRGRDATIYTDKDLRFKNDGTQAVKIRAVVEKGRMVVFLLARSGRKKMAGAES